MWAVAEFAMMIVAASVPQMPAFVKYCQARLRGCDAVSSAGEAGGDPAHPEIAMRPSPWGPWHQIDEEMTTTQTTGVLSTGVHPPHIDLDAPLPPPIVPPKDVEKQEPHMKKSSGPRCPRAPPPSPVRSHAITWYVEDSDEASCDDDLSVLRRDQSNSPMLERLSPAHLTRYKHRSI